MTEHESLGGDGGEPQVGKRKSRRGRALVVVAAVVVAVAALVVAVQFAPGSERAATTAAESSVPGTSSASASNAPASSVAVPTTQPNVPQPSEFDAWASKTSQWLDIPLRAMTGYAQATVTLTKEQPACHLSWVTLAAIGKVASDHGRAQGDHVGTDGALTKPLGTVEVRDFYGRTVSTANASGPMQLAPAVWSKWQRSASGGKPDPQNIDDAALTAGRALCAGGRDLATDWWNAVSSLQGAPVSLHRILATVNVYGTVGQSGQAPNPAVLSAVDFAIDQIGLPYVWGGNGSGDPDPGFDCSGLTTAAYGSAGVKLMRTADTQFHSVPHVSEPQLGDLIFYGEPTTKIHHVGLYIGNQQMIDAPQTGQAVQVHPYRKPGDDYAGAGRPTA
ncbi:C40 family peptidase [Amycolatopsis rhabdoformis]|uniref:C40 family peptidase n=1 Tax=Amycolatopsis rhabdoformis TaxID=1448059 RepID=A0ABZ1I9M6_9PSEU|nr:C40 family peptidase [Amycolatopsis rhabdoformis]WSE30130.1 C40 family peptidase [Amycolatopsis rhabdoformis]